MRITVFGATGQIGSRVVELLRATGHDVVPASRSAGVDVVNGTGLTAALSNTDVLVDVLNSPSYEDDPVLDFFTATSKNLVAEANAAGVGHYLALSIVNCDRMPDSGYMRAKVVQENTIIESGLPYTILRATQFIEFAEAITESLVVGDEVRVPDARIQLVAAADVSAEVARRAQETPVNGIVNIGGPAKITFAEMARMVLRRRSDDRAVIVDPGARYFGTPVDEASLVTGDDAVIAPTPFV
jgi:uncharacterized protein YbjT (DUF2867 family)